MIQIIENQTMSSREIAELTGKLHKNVLSDCDKLNESYSVMGMANISAVKFTSTNGQNYREYSLTKMQTFDLLTGYRAELRIKVNRRWEELENKAKLPDFNNPAIAARAWADQYEQKQIAEAKVKELQPKADVYDKISNTDNLNSLNDAAKILGIGRNTLMKNLRNMSVLMSNNTPYQHYIDSGYFAVKNTLITKGESMVTYPQTFVTGKGITWLSNRF